MAVEKRKKKKKFFLTKIFDILECLITKTKLIKIHNSLDSSRPYGRLLENPKTWGSRELLLPEMISKLAPE